MLLNKDYKFWFCTGSQDLYGEECLAKVAQHSKQIVDELNKTGVLPYEIVWKPTLITNELIRKTFNEANNDETCAGQKPANSLMCCARTADCKNYYKNGAEFFHILHKRLDTSTFPWSKPPHDVEMWVDNNTRCSVVLYLLMKIYKI